MNPKLAFHLNRCALAYGTTPEEILGRVSTRSASAARRAVWAALITRERGGEFTARKLSEIFGRRVSMIYLGIRMFEKESTVWRQRVRGEPTQFAGEADEKFLTRRLNWLRRRYRRLDSKLFMKERARIMEECEVLTKRQQELKGAST